MWKLLCLIFALFAVSNAILRNITFTSGNIIQGINAKGAAVLTKNNGDQDIQWKENFNKNNSLKVYYTKIYENTGELGMLEIDNLCKSFQRGSLESGVKNFVLYKLAYTYFCPIKKRAAKIRYPINYAFELTKPDPCGPFIAMINIVRNSRTIDNMQPLLISATLRGTVDGPDCDDD